MITSWAVVIGVMACDGEVRVNAGRPDTSGAGGDAAIPDAVPPDHCKECTNSLAARESLNCFCKANSCPSTVRAALASGLYVNAAVGCGYLALGRMYGPVPNGLAVTFTASGELVGAVVNTDVSGDSCVSPRGDPYDNAAGGTRFVLDEENELSGCPRARRCRLPVRADGNEDGHDVADAAALSDCDLSAFSGAAADR